MATALAVLILAGVVSGTFTITAPVRGRCTYHLRVLTQAGKVKDATTHPLYSYADVTMERLTGYSSDTVQIGSTLFRYVYREWGDAGTEIHLDSTSCRGGSLDLGELADSGATGEVDVVQESSDEQSFTIGANTTGTFPFTLDGGAVDVNLGGGGTAHLYGSSSCYTADGTR